MRKIFSLFAALTLSVGLWAAAPANVESVDLGLPSGLKWANMNVGATAPEGYGDYFAWGETEPKDNYDWSTYFDTNDGGSTFTKYNLDGGKTTLDPEDDAAHVKWGGNWRMPTKAEQDELQNNCTWTWTTLNNISGYEVKGPNNNTIFLPASGYCFGSSLGSSAGSGGYYCSSSLCESGSSDANFLLFYSTYAFCYNGSRYYGYSVRPVYAPASAPAVPYIAPVYNTEGDVTSGIARWDTLACADYKVVENATDVVTWGVAGQTTWLVVNENVTISERITCDGEVHLILADNKTLNAEQGITVSGEGNSLTIYAQTEDIARMGRLIADATSTWEAAGIGGGYGESGSYITINGGIVTATGGTQYDGAGAGIGGGADGSGFNITINGGKVTATGGEMAAGIGGGTGGGSGSNIIINGGEVMAVGEEGGAGIGGGTNGVGSNITINGGEVTATGVSAAGIGGGYRANGSNITILAGTVTANGSDAIGAGKWGEGSNIFVTTSLQVKADGNNPPTTVITNTGADLASSLAGKPYATIKIDITPIKAAAIAEINAAIDGVTDEAILAIATTAITNINNATTKEDINSIKTQALADIAAAIFAKYKADAIAEIQTAGQGIQNTEMNNWINGAITDINAAGTDTKEKVDNIKNQILPMIQLFQDGKAEGYNTGYDEGEAAVRAELPTTGDCGPTVIITKGDKTLKLYNVDEVEYKITECTEE